MHSKLLFLRKPSPGRQYTLGAEQVFVNQLPENKVCHKQQEQSVIYL